MGFKLGFWKTVSPICNFMWSIFSNKNISQWHYSLFLQLPFYMPPVDCSSFSISRTMARHHSQMEGSLTPASGPSTFIPSANLSPLPAKEIVQENLISSLTSPGKGERWPVKSYQLTDRWSRPTLWLWKSEEVFLLLSVNGQIQAMGLRVTLVIREAIWYVNVFGNLSTCADLSNKRHAYFLVRIGLVSATQRLRGHCHHQYFQLCHHSKKIFCRLSYSRQPH